MKRSRAPQRQQTKKASKCGCVDSRALWPLPCETCVHEKNKRDVNLSGNKEKKPRIFFSVNFKLPLGKKRALTGSLPLALTRRRAGVNSIKDVNTNFTSYPELGSCG